MSLVGAAGREQPFVLQAGDHVGDAAVAVRGDAAGIEGLIARGQNDRPDVDGDHRPGVREVDGPGGAEFFAGPALALGRVQAVLPVNGVLERHRLAVLQVNGLALAHPGVVVVVHLFGAFLGAQAAGDALVHIHIARLFGDRDGEIARGPGNIGYCGEGEKLDV